MKKLYLAAVVAAIVTEGAQAASYDVTSNITGVQIFLADYTEIVTGFSGLQFTGTASDSDNDGVIDSADIRMTGTVYLDVTGVPGRVIFDLANGTYAAGLGTTFKGGTLQLAYQDVPGWVTFGTVDASTTNLPFLAGQPGHWSHVYETQSTAGLLLAPGTTSLPGLWDGYVNGAGWNDAVAALTLFGQPEGVFLEGTLTLTETSTVPIPGAAWLFGSAVAAMGLVRRRSV